MHRAGDEVKGGFTSKVSDELLHKIDWIQGVRCQKVQFRKNYLSLFQFVTQSTPLLYQKSSILFLLLEIPKNEGGGVGG